MKRVKHSNARFCPGIYLLILFIFIYFLIIHLFCIVWREGQGRYELLTMVGAGGTRTCVHPHVSHPLYHCATCLFMPCHMNFLVVCLLSLELNDVRDCALSQTFLRHNDGPIRCGCPDETSHRRVVLVGPNVTSSRTN